MPARSYERITTGDLKKLRTLATKEAIFNRNPKYKSFGSSLIAITLCQGAAKHFVDRRTGVKDFDVWYFYKQVRNRKVPYPYRAVKTVDSHLEKFGRCPRKCRRKHHPKKLGDFVGRHVDLLGREIDSSIVRDSRCDPTNCIVNYLKKQRTETAGELKKKPIVGLYPPKIFGKVVWKPA